MTSIKYIEKLVLCVSLSGLLCFPAFSQANLFPAIAYGSEIESPGVTLGGEYFISQKTSIAGNFTYFLTNKDSRLFDGDIFETKSKLWELNGNLHYYFLDRSNIGLYGLGGLNYSNIGWEYKEIDADNGQIETHLEMNDGEVGLNLGIGANFNINQHFAPFTELKFVAGSTDQVVIRGGLKFEL